MISSYFFLHILYFCLFVLDTHPISKKDQDNQHPQKQRRGSYCETLRLQKNFEFLLFVSKHTPFPHVVAMGLPQPNRTGAPSGGGGGLRWAKEPRVEGNDSLVDFVSRMGATPSQFSPWGANSCKRAGGGTAHGGAHDMWGRSTGIGDLAAVYSRPAPDMLPPSLGQNTPVGWNHNRRGCAGDTLSFSKNR